MTRISLLTANLNMISRDSNLRYAVPLGVVGAVVSVLLLVACPPLRWALLDGTVPSLLLAAFMLAGICRVQGLSWTVSCLLLLLLEHYYEMQHFRRALAAGGYLFLSVSPAGHVIGLVAARLFPAHFYNAQPARVQHFGKLLREYDIACLQELTVTAGKDCFVSEVRAAAAQHGLVHFCSTGRWPVFPALMATSGLVVLSRFPITKVKPFHFTCQSWFEWSIIARGAVMVEVEGPQGRVAILNVHTTAGTEVVEQGLGARKEGAVNAAGLDQLLEVLGAFESFANSAAHKVLCGDFNLDKASPAFQVVKQRAEALGLQDCFPDSPPTSGCDDEPLEVLLSAPASRCYPTVIDHVFSNRRASSARVEKMAAPKELWGQWQQVSDHRAVAVAWS